MYSSLRICLQYMHKYSCLRHQYQIKLIHDIDDVYCTNIIVMGGIVWNDVRREGESAYTHTQREVRQHTSTLLIFIIRNKQGRQLVTRAV